ncbi:MAG: ChbG/HpnK family deacetylase, partial [Eubacteriales bacterium]|nr:ChbG/HpnK family deacetylase [Eubacteriales bacterium]
MEFGAKQIIITADDYGMTEPVNIAIREGIEAGLITAANVMVNMDACDEIADLKSEFPSVSIGIHWNLTAGKPISDRTEIKTLTDSDGNFYTYPTFRKRYRQNLIKNTDITAELDAQYNKFYTLCGKPDYWNTHQNIHMDFRIFGLFVKNAAGLGILKMRNHQRIYVPPKNGRQTQSYIWRLSEPAKTFIIAGWMRFAAKHNMRYPDGMILNLNAQDIDDIAYTMKNLVWTKGDN